MFSSKVIIQKQAEKPESCEMNEGWMKDEWRMKEGRVKDEWRMNEGWMKDCQLLKL